MRSLRSLPVSALVAVSLLASCELNEQTGGVVGGSLGALACGAVGSALFHNTLGALLPAAACGAVGYFIGSSIGKQLDEKDRHRAATATEQALNAPVPASKTGKTTHPPAKPVAWSSDHDTGAHGSSTVTAVQPQADGGQCRTVREIAYIKGQEVTQSSRYCRGADGGWVAQT